MHPLTLARDAMRAIDDAARAADVHECLGFLASRPGDDIVTTIECLDARASRTRADATPMAVKEGVDRLTRRGLIARGIWHSHGRLPVFHSGTDIATIHRLLPAMSRVNSRRGHSTPGPAVEGPSAAVLPLEDGRDMVFTLAADPVPGMDVIPTQAWTQVSTEFDRRSPIGASLQPSLLRLSACGVVISLGVPDGARLEAQVVDRAASRIARVYSLVVNTRQERYAQCLAIATVAGETFTRLDDCDVVVLEGSPNGAV